MMSSSSSSSVSSSRRIGEENNEDQPLTGMLLGLQELEERIIATTTCTNTQLRVPLIIDTIGCDITIDDIQLAKQELLNQKFDLNKDVNKGQKIIGYHNDKVTPMIHFCGTGNLLVVKLLFLIGANCTKLSKDRFWSPMLAAAERSHLDICKWLFEYGGVAKYQINKETTDGETPLSQSYFAWKYGNDKDGKTCKWLLLNGGGQHLSSNAMRRFVIYREEEMNSNLLVLWMRENIQLHDTFILLLCGAAPVIATSSSSEPSDDDSRKRKRKIHPKRSLQILHSHPGIMELIGNYVGLIRGKEIRMLQEFNELVIEYNTTDEN